MSTLGLRRRLKQHHIEFMRLAAIRDRLMMDPCAARWRAEYFVDYGFLPPAHPLPQLPQFPPECRGMVCGAWGRQKGRPCQRKDIYLNGRCRLHGGLSTGPKSAKGKAVSAANLPKPKPHGLLTNAIIGIR